MNWLTDGMINSFLLVPLSAWLVTQLAKFIIHAIACKECDIKRLFGDGGMPSGHSATVCALAAYTAMIYGTVSFEFALAAILALIVCHDAMGVRRETGKQAVILNEMRKNIDNQTLNDIKIKEFVGHTPLQVIVGGVIGIVIANVWFLLL